MNSNQASTKTVNSQVQNLQDLMRDNIQKAVKRGEQLEQLEQRTDYLDASASEFQVTANKAKKKFFFKNLKWTIILVVVIVLIFLFIILGIYLSFKK